MKLELLAKCLNELIKDRPEFADKDICIEQTSNNESKIYVAQYDETSKSWTKLYWIKNLDTIKESIKQNMKKTYKVKNYKGNLVESVKKFQQVYKNLRIVEAFEDGNDLKIKAEQLNERINEDNWKFCIVKRGYGIQDTTRYYAQSYSKRKKPVDGDVSAERMTDADSIGLWQGCYRFRNENKAYNALMNDLDLDTTCQVIDRKTWDKFEQLNKSVEATYRDNAEVKESISDDEKRENNNVSIESVTIEDLIHIAEFVGGYVLDMFKVSHSNSVVSIAHKFNDILDDDSEAQHSGDLLLDINEHTDEALTKLYEKDRILAVKMYKMLNKYRINKENGSRDINKICPAMRKLSQDRSKPMELLYGLFKNIFFYADDIRSGIEYF